MAVQFTHQGLKNFHWISRSINFSLCGLCENLRDLCGKTNGIEEFLLDQAEKKGIEKGIEQGIREAALKMKQNGLEISLIANITGLSIKEIEKLS